MKANILRTVCFTFIAVLMNGFVSKAQETFYDIKMDNGKVTSKAQYVMGKYGTSIKESESKFTYDANGDLLKKETFVWNPTYEKNNNGRYYADYSEKNWTPAYCILYNKDSINNFVSVELCLWNTGKKMYGNPVKTMVFQLNDLNRYNYLAFQKGKKYNEVINNIKYDKDLLVSLTK